MTLRTLAPFLLLLSATARAATHTIDFEDLSLPPDSFENGMPTDPTPGVVYDGSFTSGGATFNNTFLREDFNGFLYDSWGGWSYSNLGDTATAGFGNQYSSFAGGALEGPDGIFGVGFASSQISPVPASPSAYIDLPAVAYAPTSMEVHLTNTTYAALSMRNGDPFAKRFGGITGDDPDYLKLTILGYDGLGASGSVLGSVDFYLADYRSSDNALDFIVSEWTRVDLTSLLGAKSLGFRMDSTDRIQFGGPGSPVYLNTPTYFALDGLSLTGATAVVPEPASLALLAIGVTGSWMASKVPSRRHRSKWRQTVLLGGKSAGR